jgi:HEPN domain-containing protein
MTGEFRVQTTNPILKFLFVFTNAQGFYVCARRALLLGYTIPGCIGAHQTVELFAKAILHVAEIPAHGRHALKDLLTQYQSQVPYFATVLANPELVTFLDGLSEGYNALRYGEAGFNIDSGHAIQMLDELAYNLRGTYLEIVKAPSSDLYVALDDQELFLRDNKHFSQQDITNHPFASIGGGIAMKLGRYKPGSPEKPSSSEDKPV